MSRTAEVRNLVYNNQNRLLCDYETWRDTKPAENKEELEEMMLLGKYFVSSHILILD